MIKVNLLKSAIVAKNMTQDEFCKKIGMAHSTFIRKMKIRRAKYITANTAIKFHWRFTAIIPPKNLTVKTKSVLRKAKEKTNAWKLPKGVKAYTITHTN